MTNTKVLISEKYEANFALSTKKTRAPQRLLSDVPISPTQLPGN